MIAVAPYPGLALQVLAAEFPAPLQAQVAPPWLELLRQGDGAGVPPAVQAAATDALRTAVRDLLRRHGYRPTGRGKPSSEYLRAAVADGRLGAINVAVDAGNAVSLHSALPISVVDRDRLHGALRVDVPPPGTSYVFNRAGQQIDVAGLPSLADDEGFCANAVKDAQRTKTTADTTRVLALVWGCVLPDPQHAPRTGAWLADVLARLGARVEVVG